MQTTPALRAVACVLLPWFSLACASSETDGPASSGGGATGAGGGEGGAPVGGAASSSTSTTGVGGSGAGSPMTCQPFETQACYSGPAGTQNVGSCVGGVSTCDASGMSFGPCVGEVLPATENCATEGDDDCDGQDAGATCGQTLFALRYGDALDQQGNAVAIGPSGDIVLAAYFEGTVDVGGGPLTSPTSDTDVLVAKFDAAGNHLWSKQFFATKADDDYALNVAVSVSGAVIVAGGFVGTADFGNGTVASAGTSDAFVVELDGDGNHVWSHTYGDAEWQASIALSVDPTGNVYFGVANEDGAVDLGGGPFVAVPGGQVGVLGKLDANGGHLWSKQLGGWVTGLDLVAGADDLAIAGTVHGAVDLGGGFVGGQCGIFVGLVDPDAGHIWTHGYQGADSGDGDECHVRVARGAAGEVVLAGGFRDTMVFEGTSLVSAGDADVFVARLDATGALVHVDRYGGAERDMALDVAVAADGDTLTTGFSFASVDLGGGPLAGGFVARFDAFGAPLWSRGFPSGLGRALASSATTPVLVAGQFDSTLDLASPPLSSSGGYDGFLAALSE
jgi:hypothetical protein